MNSKINKKKRILVTAGPTRERLDPVRFISNYSTGTIGYEIAKEAKRRAHTVTLISGPTALSTPKGVRLISVESALDMKKAVLREFSNADIVIMAAAVSDWRAQSPTKHKGKKGYSKYKNLKLVKNPDILAELGRKKDDKVLVGFALETEDLEKNALKKLKSKKADIIFANMLGPGSCVFGDGAVKYAVMIDGKGCVKRLPNRSKKRLAEIILDKALNYKL